MEMIVHFYAIANYPSNCILSRCSISINSSNKSFSEMSVIVVDFNRGDGHLMNRCCFSFTSPRRNRRATAFRRNFHSLECNGTRDITILFDCHKISFYCHSFFASYFYFSCLTSRRTVPPQLISLKYCRFPACRMTLVYNWISIEIVRASIVPHYDISWQLISSRHKYDRLSFRWFSSRIVSSYARKFVDEMKIKSNCDLSSLF